MDSGDVAIQAVYPIMKSMVHKGCDAEHFCKYASFDTSLLKDAEARIAGEELERLMVAAAEYTGDAYFGLHQGQVTEFADMGIVGYVMMHSATVGEALAAYRRYNSILCSGFNLDWELDGDEIEIRLFLQHPGTMSRHCAEDMASSIHTLMGRLANRRIALRGVRFMHEAPADTVPYLEAFGTEPRFGRESHALAVGKEVLEYPVLYSDAGLLEMFEAKAQEKKEELDGAGKFSGRVFQWMKRCHPAPFPTLQQTAAAFLMSPRTLQAKLKEESSSYNELSVRVRKEAAISYLNQLEYSIGEVAYVLHFSEQSAFQSAFKKWTGLTPGQYRAQIRPKPAGT